MARPQSAGLTENELLVMKVLWTDSSLSIAEILERVNRKPLPAYTSVLTLVQAMEKKGYVSHTQVGKAYLYSPVLKQKDYEKKEIIRAAKRVVNGNPLQLAINIVKNEHLSKSEIRELKKLLEDL